MNNKTPKQPPNVVSLDPEEAQELPVAATAPEVSVTADQIADLIADASERSAHGWTLIRPTLAPKKGR